MRRNDRNKGFSLIELIIVIAIMAVLIGIVTPMFVKYVEKSRKARDLTNADRIATAINLAFTADPDAYDAFMKFGFKNDGSLDNGRAADFEVTVNGVTEKYKLIPVRVNGKEYNYRFSGTMSEFYDKNGKEGLYSFINKELGLKPTGDNGFINPKYTKTRKGKNQKGKAYNDICCWRICKRADNGTMEIWAADSSSWAGWPVYRVWPVPDDVYTKQK